METDLEYRLDDAVYVELDKLLRHMKERCELDKLLVTLERYVPEYLRYSEVDLVLGDEKIFIATIHKAKGLEFENVIIPQAIDDIYPHYYSRTPEQIREDARLLYVAMTRAKRNLLVTYPTEKRRGRPARHSRFLHEGSVNSLFGFRRIPGGTR
jgi:superfamily I DNA/RNA helicase